MTSQSIEGTLRRSGQERTEARWAEHTREDDEKGVERRLEAVVTGLSEGDVYRGINGQQRIERDCRAPGDVQIAVQRMQREKRGTRWIDLWKLWTVSANE